jgi:hypothetical protein
MGTVKKDLGTVRAWYERTVLFYVGWANRLECVAVRVMEAKKFENGKNIINSVRSLSFEMTVTQRNRR